jgi:hypothetical protein
VAGAAIDLVCGTQTSLSEVRLERYSAVDGIDAAGPGEDLVWGATVSMPGVLGEIFGQGGEQPAVYCTAAGLMSL